MSALVSQEEEMARLRRQVRELSEELEEYRRGGAVGLGGEAETFLPPQAWQLSPRERTVLRVLLARPVASRDAVLMAFNYGPEWDGDQKIVDVLLCRMRKKLAPFGIAIRTIWKEGWALTPSAKAAIMAACLGGEICVGEPVETSAPATMLSRVRDVLRSATTPLLCVEVAERVAQSGDPRSVQQIGSVLAVLFERGEVVRDERHSPHASGRRFIYAYALAAGLS